MCHPGGAGASLSSKLSQNGDTKTSKEPQGAAGANPERDPRDGEPCCGKGWQSWECPAWKRDLE